MTIFYVLLGVGDTALSLRNSEDPQLSNRVCATPHTVVMDVLPWDGRGGHSVLPCGVRDDFTEEGACALSLGKCVGLCQAVT